MKIYIKVDPPFEWVRVEGFRAQAFGEVSSLADYPINVNEDEVIAVVSGQWVTSHSVSLPAKTRKQFMAALPYALEEFISEDVENIHFVCPQWRASEECLVYAVAKDKMLQWQESATLAELPISELLPDYALLPQHEAAQTSLCLSDDTLLAKQSDGQGVYVERDFVNLWLNHVDPKATVAVNDKELTEQLIKDYPGRDFRHWPFGHKMAHWLEQPQSHSVSHSNGDLLNEQYRPVVRTTSIKQFALPAAVFLLGVFVVMAFDTYRYLGLHYENRQIDAKMVSVIQESFPEIDIVSPDNGRFMMEQALARRTGSSNEDNFHALLAVTSKVLKSQNVSLTDLVYREEQLVITCLLRDFSQADRIAQQLNGRHKITASLESSSANGNKITARYNIRQG